MQSGTHVSPSGVSLIDLIFASFLYTCSALPPLGSTDHSGLQLVVNIKCSRRKQRNQRLLWNYSQGDYIKARHMIDRTDWDASDINVTLQKVFVQYGRVHS